jgi:probable F420-dependent oxidoreductase
VKLGVHLPNHGPDTDPGRLRAWAQLAEGLGYDLLLMSDHVAVTPDVATQYPAPFYEPFTALSWLAGATTRITLGTSVLIVPYRHPLLTARMAGDLDRLSGGRFVLGVGVGYARQEFEALGLPFGRRGAMTDDYLAAIRAHLNEDVTSHDGPFARYAGVQTGPRPAPGGVPIWVGGNSDAALRRAVAVGDAWHPLRFTVAQAREQLAVLAKLAAAAGRPTPGFAPVVKLKLADRPVTDPDRQPGQGTPEQVLDDLRALRELGAEAVVFDAYNDDIDETRHPHLHWRALTEVMTLAQQDGTRGR